MTDVKEILRSFPLQRPPERIRFEGRILLLAEDPDIVRQQLLGEDVPWSPEIKLRDDISTDEITPAYICYYYDETLGEYPYHGLKAGAAFPFKEYFEKHKRGSVRAGGFAVSVSGKRRGKGSSREQSPYAEMVAGIRLVIAENIERIYKQNCQNLGVLTWTDFSLLERIGRGEEIPLEEFTRGEDPITRQVIEFGGLFPFNVARLRGEAIVPPITTKKRPMTLAEKILAGHFVADAATGRTGSEGICHSIVYQDHALPGQVVIGSDSHTPHSGALGCVAFGVGTTDIFNSWITKDVRVRVPESVLVRVNGRKPDNLTAKDFMLAILRHPYVKSGHAIGKIVEYAGTAVEALSVDERATMTNMAAEVGAFTGIIAPDEKTVEFLVEMRGMPREKAMRLCEGRRSDRDAEFAELIEIDASSLQPMVALPGDPGNGRSLDELPGPVKIDIAYGGSCTAGKREDMDMYARVLREGLAQGRRVHPEVTFWIQFGSQEVKRYCERMGYIELFEKAGAKVIEPSCGACINAGPGVSTRTDQVTISAINRNFPGRSGPGQMYLASPLTVAASALAGHICDYQPSVR